jgi:hypothetical protein
MADDPKAKDLVRRWKARLQDLGPYHQHCEDLARVLLPARLGFISQVYDGDRRSEDIYDGTGMQAARSLANAVDGMLWPDGEQPFFLEPVDDDIHDDEEVRTWLADSEQRMLDAFENPKARFRQSRGESNLDLVTFGGAHIFVGEAASRTHLLFQTLHPKDAVPLFDDEGNPNGMFRKHKFSLRQAIDRFTKEKLSPQLQEKCKEREPKYDECFEFLHCVVQRKEAPRGAMLARNLPYTDIWLEVDTAHIVQEGGFHEFPFACPRWDTSSGDTTGRGPGMIALPDANTLQAMEETLLIAGQRAAAPPLLAPNDGAFDAANTFPDGISYYDVALAQALGTIPIQPLETGAKMPIVLEMQDKKREQVWAAFLRNVLNLPVDGPQMTAEEIRARREEIMREIGPVFGRLDTDNKAPQVERAFMVMMRAMQFLPIPDVLQGRQIRFRYSSPVKKLRKMIEAATAAAFYRERAEMVKLTGDPSHLDIVDTDALGQFQAEANNIPNIIIRSPQKIEEIRQQRQQAQQEAQQAQMAQMEADALQKGSQAVKNLQPERPAA